MLEEIRKFFSYNAAIQPTSLFVSYTPTNSEHHALVIPAK